MSIANSGHDERGRYRGGKAGDQGGEYTVRSWYDRPWNCVLRYPDSKVAEDIALMARHAAENDCIGYDQDDRVTFWANLRNVPNYDPASIRTPCEADCSAGVLTVIKGVGYRRGIEALKNVNHNGWTGSMRQQLTAAGFKCLTDSKYLKSDSYLLPGDVLLNDQHHTAINLTRGMSVGSKKSESSSAEGYVPGTWVTVVDRLNVRTGAGAGYRKKAKGELTTDGKVHAYGDGSLRKNTRVTVSEFVVDSIDNVWGRIPSGWICVMYGGKAYAERI